MRTNSLNRFLYAIGYYKRKREREEKAKHEAELDRMWLDVVAKGAQLYKKSWMQRRGWRL